MSKSKIFQLLITVGSDEEVLIVREQECYPNELGTITPPVTVEYNGTEYILKRQHMEDVYVYSPSNRKTIDDLLD